MWLKLIRPVKGPLYEGGSASLKSLRLPENEGDVQAIIT